MLNEGLRERYFAQRDRIILSQAQAEESERRVFNKVALAVERSLSDIASLVDETDELQPFWRNHAPETRGRAPTGANTPWGQVIESASLRIIEQVLATDSGFQGISPFPFGGDTRIKLDDFIVHLDAKATGPKDSQQPVVVAATNQLSGKGDIFNTLGVANDVVSVRLKGNSDRAFQPRIPPFILTANDEVIMTATMFLKVFYAQRGGRQPVEAIKLVCVPNGLFIWSSEKYRDIFAEGKDGSDVSIARRRLRVVYDKFPNTEKWRVCSYTRGDMG